MHRRGPRSDVRCPLSKGNVPNVRSAAPGQSVAPCGECARIMRKWVSEAGLRGGRKGSRGAGFHEQGGGLSAVPRVRQAAGVGKLTPHTGELPISRFDGHGATCRCRRRESRMNRKLSDHGSLGSFGNRDSSIVTRPGRFRLRCKKEGGVAAPPSFFRVGCAGYLLNRRSATSPSRPETRSHAVGGTGTGGP